MNIASANMASIHSGQKYLCPTYAAPLLSIRRWRSFSAFERIENLHHVLRQNRLLRQPAFQTNGCALNNVQCFISRATS